MKLSNRQGVTLVELMVAVVISVIAILAAAMPFIAERSFWGRGRRQVEAQRDAQMALHSMARYAHQSEEYEVNGAGNRITFHYPNTVCASTRIFRLGGISNDQFLLEDNCASPAQTTVLIDGNRSEVTNLLFTAINERLIGVRIEVTHKNQQNELLQTELYLRNAST